MCLQDAVTTDTSSDPGFDAAFMRCFPRALRVAQRIVGDAATAEDLAAEALARAYARWPDLATTDYVDAWVLRVTTHLALNSARRRALVWPGRRDSRPLDGAVSEAMSLQQALRSLPRRQREVVVLCEMEGFTQEEVGRLLHLSRSSVKTHLGRGLDALRAQLEDVPSWTTT